MESWLFYCIRLSYSSDLGPLQGILVALREEDDESAQLSALNELCEMLSISTEESLQTFPVEQMIPVLVRGRKVAEPCAV